MDKVLLALHLLLAIGLVAVVLLQRSEGGGLGMGGGGSGSFMTGRGTANFLTRVTAGLATAFFITSIALTLVARHGARPSSPLDLPSLPPLSKPGATTPATTPAADPKSATPAPVPASKPGTTPLPPAATTPVAPPEKK